MAQIVADAIFSRFEAAGAPELGACVGLLLCDLCSHILAAWISQEVTYGLLLAPCSDTEDGEPRCALTFAETEVRAHSNFARHRQIHNFADRRTLLSYRTTFGHDNTLASTRRFTIWSQQRGNRAGSASDRGSGKSMRRS